MSSASAVIWSTSNLSRTSRRTSWKSNLGEQEISVKKCVHFAAESASVHAFFDRETVPSCLQRREFVVVPARGHFDLGHSRFLLIRIDVHLFSSLVLWRPVSDCLGVVILTHCARCWMCFTTLCADPMLLMSCPTSSLNLHKDFCAMILISTEGHFRKKKKTPGSI